MQHRIATSSARLLMSNPLFSALLVAGGVIVSYFEWVQNRLGFKWTKNRVYRRSDSIIKQAFNNVFAISKKYNISLRTAAYIAAIDKVSRTYKYRDGSFTFQKNGEDS